MLSHLKIELMMMHAGANLGNCNARQQECHSNTWWWYVNITTWQWSSDWQYRVDDHMRVQTLANATLANKRVIVLHGDEWEYYDAKHICTSDYMDDQIICRCKPWQMQLPPARGEQQLLMGCNILSPDLIQTQMRIWIRFEWIEYIVTRFDAWIIGKR